MSSERRLLTIKDWPWKTTSPTCAALLVLIKKNKHNLFLYINLKYNYYTCQDLHSQHNCSLQGQFHIASNPKCNCSPSLLKLMLPLNWWSASMVRFLILVLHTFESYLTLTTLATPKSSASISLLNCSSMSKNRVLVRESIKPALNKIQ